MDRPVIDPELRAAAARLGVPPIDRALLRRIIRTVVRVMPVPKIAGVRIRAARIGDTRLRIYQPTDQRTTAGMLWIHGGGFLIGDARQDEGLCAETAAALGIVIVSANYRLAPEHPFPAARDDLRDAWFWLQIHAATLGVDPARVAIGGESAGGGLATTLVQHLHDESLVQPIAQWLFCPMLDDRTAANRELDAIDHWIWNNAANRVGWRAYLGMEPGSPDVPPGAVPARRGDLRGLPPTFLCVGDIDLFAGEVQTYAERLRAAGVAVTLTVIPGAPHGFETWARLTPPARRLLKHAQDWLRTVLITA
jgi:acetyl esterase/lipase